MYRAVYGMSWCWQSSASSSGLRFSLGVAPSAVIPYSTRSSLNASRGRDGEPGLKHKSLQESRRREVVEKLFANPVLYSRLKKDIPDTYSNKKRRSGEALFEC